jgi:hypothetical protein
MRIGHSLIKQHFRFVFTSISIVLTIWALRSVTFNRSDTASNIFHGMQIAQAAGSCCTSYGQCRLNQLRPLGSPCYCASRYGPIPGYACN